MKKLWTIIPIELYATAGDASERITWRKDFMRPASITLISSWAFGPCSLAYIVPSSAQAKHDDHSYTHRSRQTGCPLEQTHPGLTSIWYSIYLIY